jgi:putative spermidine/putrescine transport system substrate-binding protein
MIHALTRRGLLGAAGAGLCLAGVPGRAAAQGQDALSAVTWGGPWHDGCKELAARFARQRPLNVSWELHQGGAVRIIPKIRATWPQVNYDLVNGWAPVWAPMAEEGWLEPLDDLPNMADVAEQYRFKDRQGRNIAAPMNLANVMWGYRSDLVREPIRGVEDLLRPNLRGMIMLRTPTSYTGLQMISLALEFGGDERNIEPAFDFLKRLARSGNIGRVGGGDVETVNALTTGEAAVGFGASGVFSRIGQAGPVQTLHKVDGSRGFKGFLYTEGWCVLRGPRAALAKEFANFCLSPESNTEYNRIISGGPTSRRAQVSPAVERYFYGPGEAERYAYFADYPHIVTQLDAWNRRFETEIIPLIRRA